MRWEEERWRDTPEEMVERRYATVDRLGEWSGQDRPALEDTMKRLDVVKGEHTHLHGERTDVNAAVENALWMEQTFGALGFDYHDVHAAGMGLGLQLADELIALLNGAGELSESDFRKRLMVQFGDAWVDGVLVGAEHRKAVS